MKTRDFSRTMVRTLAVFMIFSSVAISWYRSEYVVLMEQTASRFDALFRTVASTQRKVEAEISRQQGNGLSSDVDDRPAKLSPQQRAAALHSALSQAHAAAWLNLSFWVILLILLFLRPSVFSEPLRQGLPDLLNHHSALRIAFRLAGIYQILVTLVLVSSVAIVNLWMSSAKFDLNAFWPCFPPFVLGMGTLALNGVFARLVLWKTDLE